MLYVRNQEAKLMDELFANPGNEYRSKPFWAWNGKLNREMLFEQIEIMKQMGMGGFHIHVRTGMDSPYLDSVFMQYVKECVQKADKEGMQVWLYDEDRWPSGTAGGKVTRNHPEYAAKSLLFTTNPYSKSSKEKKDISIPGRGRGGVRQNNGVLLAVYDIILNQDGTLKSYEIIDEDGMAKGVKWYAYLEHGIADPWFNDAPYVDTLSSDAIEQFINITHESYKRELGNKFGSQIPAIFTDEPQFNEKSTLSFAKEQVDVFLPWTEDIEKTFQEAYGEELLPGIPELLWELPGKTVSKVRYRYHNHVADRFAESFCKQIGEWCRNHGVALTGHMLGEGSLKSQTKVIGDAMRCYRYFEIPGIDILCDRREYTTAKQAQSIMHQMGREALMSELYGVTGWDCDFRTYKLQGDWQAALGVTVRVPHLFWMTMKGEAKRDYPASIGYQSPWYKQYFEIEDYFARLNTALTRGEPLVKIAVVHPIESYWLHFGPEEQTGGIREQMDKQFHELAEILLFHGLDFDYICENELPYFCMETGYPLKVGKMSYETVLVCGCETLRKTTVQRLLDFQDKGGQVIFIGEPPCYVDGEWSDLPKEILKQGERIDFNEAAILNALEPIRFLDFRREDGRRETRLLHQIRKDHNGIWLFVATGKQPECQDIDDGSKVRIIMNGIWKITLYDALKGEKRKYPAQYKDGKTIIEKRWYIHDSLLLWLEKGKIIDENKTNIDLRNKAEVLLGTVKIELSEPNMLLLDIAEYALDHDDYMPEEELLRIDNIVRRKLNIPVRRKEVVQPYLIEQESFEHYLYLRFRILSEVEVSNVELGLEDKESTQIWLNGEFVNHEAQGYFVDSCIHKVPLPVLKKGENILEVRVPVGKRTNLEYFYLLGDFGVRLNGTVKTVVAPIRRIGFGNITNQGLPFYTGNIIYKAHFRAEKDLQLRIPRYRGALVKIFIDGVDQGNIIFSPYQIDLSHLYPGEHEIEIELFGTRQNGFGQLHHTPGFWFYQSPNSWRSEGQRWSYEYQLKEAGILGGPELYGGCWLET